MDEHNPTAKILPLPHLAAVTAAWRAQGLRLVLCHGAFDLLHPGHLRHLQRAREEGDRLIVTITADAFINKGPGRPVFPDFLRAESLGSLSFVDHVAVIHDPTGLPAIHCVQPAVYAKGNDYREASQDLTGNIRREQEAVEAHGGTLLFTNEVTYSSTNLLNQYFELFSPEVRTYLAELRRQYTAEELIDRLRSLSPIRVLVVGEAIVDEYCYSSPLGLTGKSGNILAVRYNHRELFAGGSLAVANHLAGFANQVTLLTCLGTPPNNHEAFIRSKLLPNVTPHFHFFPAAPTLVKRRYVDADINKLFEVYTDDPAALTPPLDQALCQWLEKHAPSFDLVVVPDYGNGMISPNLVNALSRTARFLAVNTQINSGNRGYHVITRYPRADHISLNEPEVRLAAHNRQDPLGEVAREIGARVGARTMAVTLGTQGAMMLDLTGEQTYTALALSSRVVDRIGAGDAFLAISALCLAGNLPPAASLFLGSVAAALDVQVVCNRDPISPVDLFKYVTTLLK